MEIIFNKLSYIENKSSSGEKKYLEDINLIINQGSIVSFINEDLNIIGKLLMVIKRPTKGELKIDNTIIKRTSHISNVNELRKRIGFVYTSGNKFLTTIVKEEIKLEEDSTVEPEKEEFEIYRDREMRQLESDFDKMVKMLKVQ